MQRVVLVIGAGRDIGAAAALAIARPGDRVVLHAATSVAGAEAVRDRLRAAGAHGVVVQADLAEASRVHRPVAATEAALQGGTLRGVVHNAALTLPAPADTPSADALARMFAVNLVAPRTPNRASAGRMAPGASIVAPAVSRDAVVSPDFDGFFASNAAPESLVRRWAVALGPPGVRANTVAPGVIEANVRADLVRDPAFRAGVGSATALRRNGRVDDLAGAIGFLMSEAPAWVTAQVLDVSGGSRLCGRLTPPASPRRRAPAAGPRSGRR